MLFNEVSTSSIYVAHGLFDNVVRPDQWDV